MLKITLERCGANWRACLTDHPGRYTVGPTEIAAVGRLIMSFPHSCDVELRQMAPAPLDGLAPSNAGAGREVAL